MHPQTAERKAIQLATVLRNLLTTHGLKASDIARKTGIAPQVLSDWLAGTTPRSLVQVKVLADFFGITIDELCFGEKVGMRMVLPLPPQEFEGLFEVRFTPIRMTAAEECAKGPQSLN